eukprot:g9188.t1
METQMFTKVLNKKSKKKGANLLAGNNMNQRLENYIINYLKTRTGDMGLMSQIGGSLFSQGKDAKIFGQWVKNKKGGLKRFLFDSNIFSLYKSRNSHINESFCIHDGSEPNLLLRNWPKEYYKVTSLTEQCMHKNQVQSGDQPRQRLLQRQHVMVIS